jgi:hypothetical protein
MKAVESVTCNDVPEEFHGLGQLLRTLSLPLNGERGHGGILQVHANRRELHELPLNLQSPFPCAR